MTALLLLEPRLAVQLYHRLEHSSSPLTCDKNTEIFTIQGKSLFEKWSAPTRMAQIVWGTNKQRYPFKKEKGGRGHCL